MKNVHLIETDKPGRLWTNNLRRRLELDEFPSQHPSNIAKHLYITSDEEIKEGDYVFNLTSRYVYSITELWEIVSYERKIILTTDQDLINHGVQAIDEEFLQWFVKNANESGVYFDRCEIEKWTDYKYENNKEVPYDCYKIIIPKEPYAYRLIMEDNDGDRDYGFVTKSGTAYIVQISDNRIHQKYRPSLPTITEVQFGAVDKDEKLDLNTQTGDNDIYKIMATIVTIVKDYIKKYPTNIIKFNPAKTEVEYTKDIDPISTVRTQLYSRYIKTQFPNAEITQSKSSDEEIKVILNP